MTDSAPLVPRRLLGRAGVTAIAVGATGALLHTREVQASASYEDTYSSYGPLRLIDSRSGLGGYRGPIIAGQTRIYNLSHLFAPTIGDLVCNITVVNTRGAGYLTFWGAGDRPTTSDINWWGRGQTIANATHLRTTTSGGEPIFSYFCGGADNRTDVIVDIKGYFYNPNRRASSRRRKGPAEK